MAFAVILAVAVAGWWLTASRWGQSPVTRLLGLRCRCGWLEKAADDDAIPVLFDEVTREYCIFGENHRRILYYCPFCGGKAPQSRRAQLFAEVSYSEVSRLTALMRGLATEQEVVDRLGPPSWDGVDTCAVPSSGKSPTVFVSRCLVFEDVSESADVRVRISHDGRAEGFSLSGKYVGPRREAK